MCGSQSGQRDSSSLEKRPSSKTLIAPNAHNNDVNFFLSFFSLLLCHTYDKELVGLLSCQSPHSHTYATHHPPPPSRPAFPQSLPTLGDKPRVSVLHSDNNGNSFTSSPQPLHTSLHVRISTHWDGGIGRGQGEKGGKKKRAEEGGRRERETECYVRERERERGDKAKREETFRKTDERESC